LKSGKFKKEIDMALASTALVFNLGTCWYDYLLNFSSVKVGFSEMSTEELVQNVMDCIEGVVAKIPGKWANIRCINIKTAESTALPIYNALPVVDESTDGNE
jgi:ribosome biogenesis protein UTP30